MNNTNITFLMPPNYVTNNDLQVDNYTATTGTLYFNTPTTATNLAILATSGGGGSTVSYTVTHSDSSTDSGTFNMPDWFNGGPTVAWGANGRITAAGSYENFNNSTVNNQAPYLYDNNITVSGATPITSITFTYNSGGEYNFYAVSGNASGTKWTPIPVSGFNEIATVPAAFPLTATMDAGTNTIYQTSGNLNTWFEQGYYQDLPSSGLPPSGSTFNSQSQPTHHYQMGNYSANNAILIDTNHQSANIVISSPQVYSAFAFLTAGAYIGSAQMTNICILQHQDGVSETNVFYGYDWFNTSFPGSIAFEANGRVNMDNRTLNSTNDNFPYLFESYFTLSDLTSPVTNILVKYGSAPAADSTTYIMAVSASTGGVPPVITQGPLPTNQIWYPSQTATFNVVVTGTTPITNVWLVESNGAFYPLQNGVDANGSTVSGATTTTLSISDLTLADATNYEYVATNAFGGVTSTEVSLTINAGTPLGPVIDSQSPAASPSAFDVLTNHPITTTFSLVIDSNSAPPFTYQWYQGTPGSSTAIPGATNATFANVDVSNTTIYAVVSNFVGGATSSPVSIDIVPIPTPSPYQSAVLAYKPVAYWPLNETNGTTAFDYAGTNNGTYIGGYTLGEPGLPDTAGIGSNTSVTFDGTTGYVDVPVGRLNILGPLTLIEWVQTSGESDFATPLGHSDNGYRFDVDGGGIAHFADDGPDVTSTASIANGNWHQLIGVYDGTKQYLYIDGQPVGTPITSTPIGSSDDVIIAGAPDYGNRYFTGNICQVAILTNALTASEVTSVYNSLDIPPQVTISPATPSVYAGSSITLTASSGGTPPFTYQWYYIDNSNNSNNIAGATNVTYTISNASPDENGYNYGVIVTSPYGSSTGVVILTVNEGPAYIAADLSPLYGESFVGAPATYTVFAAGTAPFYYSWTLDGNPVSGATSSTVTLTPPVGTHTIQAIVTNADSAGSPAFSSPASLQVDASPTNITFNTDGTGWQLNTPGAVPTIASNVLELTSGTDGQDATAFYSVGQYVGNFTASFIYVGDGGADGAAFVLQNTATGPSILGGGGGGLGYFGITNSIALEINLYIFPGIAPGTNGNTYGDGGGLIYATTGSVAVNSADPILFNLSYINGNMAVKMTDTTTSATYTTNYQFSPLVPLLGGSDLAFIGFTGADGGTSSVQTISDFEFNAILLAPALTISPLTAGSFILSWPASDTSYVLQETSSLTPPITWSPGPTPTVVNGNNQVTITIPHGGGNEFYRLAP
jgi:hypothetical protein